jgi:CitB family two-component system sensor histidine kinase MalK
MNKLHVISAMIQTESYEELDDYVMSISSNYRQEVGWVTAYVKDPVLAGYLMNKISNLQENGIEVELSGSGMWPAMADPEWTDHMITIIGNLIDNARDAMKQTPSPHLFMHIYVENSYLGFQIEDNGRGMDEKTQAELFERGYSTKGEGRGFGMYNTKRSLETLQADVFIDSQPGEGTAFDVQIPIKKEN